MKRCQKLIEKSYKLKELITNFLFKKKPPIEEKLTKKKKRKMMYL